MTITVIPLLTIIFTILAILLALIYLIPIVLIRRFHHLNNIFTINLCLAAICCDTYWLIYYIMFSFYPKYLYNDKIYFTLNYFQMMCTIQVPLATIGVSVHRLCSIVYYTNVLFKKKRWAIICIASQWLIGIVVSLPRLSIITSVSGIADKMPRWMGYYTFIMVVVIPSFICLINNIIIFRYVRSLTNRIQSESIGSNNNHHGISRRDLHLLRHMIIMFCIFVGGWSPIYLYIIIDFQVNFTSIVVSILILLAELSLLIDIINLFLYNHKLRQYLQNKIFDC